jgi:acid phosphatase family membrane protein YuiD
MLFANVIRDWNIGHYFMHPWFWSAFLGWIVAQTIKMVLAAFKKKIFDFEYLVSTGGMPSANTAMVTALTMSVGLTEGFGSPVAMVALGFTAVTMFDAATVRRAAGEQAKVLNRIVKAGKARYIGISNCFAWQIVKANALAEKEGFAKFVSIQGHYNLIFREEEREMVPYCEEENIALTPYSALASGRLSRLPGEGGTKRAQEDAYAKFKYDATTAQDNVIIARVAELAKKRGVTMTEVSLAWLLTKVTSPVVGATKFHHIEGAAKAVDLELTPEEIMYLEEPYVPHPLAGVMAQNKPAAAKEKHVWSTGDQKIGK